MASQLTNPLLYQTREGSLTDPYVDKVESVKPINGRAALEEVPVKEFGVIVDGYIEKATNTPIGTEFYVDYTNGVLYFQPNLNATVTVRYKGRGVVLIPAERIYYGDAENNKTLDVSLTSLQSLAGTYEDEIQLTNEATGLAMQAKAFAQEQGAYALAQGDYAKAMGLNAKGTAEAAVGSALSARDEALAKAQLADEAARTSKVTWLDAVETFSDLARVYPNPVETNQAQVKDTGYIYRFENGQWNSRLFSPVHPSELARHTDRFIATQGQTIFNTTKPYFTNQDRIDVYVSGVKQASGIDFNETSPTRITLTTGCEAGEIVETVYLKTTEAQALDLIEQVQAAEAATTAANAAKNEALSAATSTKLIWKDPVANFAALATTYPTATDGWTAATKDNGKIYRKNGTEWKLIQEVDLTAYNALDTKVTSQLAETAQQKVGGGVLALMSDLSQEVKTAMTGGSVAVVGTNAVLDTNIVNKQVSPIKLMDSETPVVKTASNYTSTGALTHLYIPNVSMGKGVLSVKLFSNAVATGRLYLLRKNGTFFDVVGSKQISVVAGENTIITDFVTSGSGDEYLGTFAIPIKFAASGGTGYFQASNFVVGTTSFNTEDKVASAVDFGIYPTFSYIPLTTKYLDVADRVGAIEEEIDSVVPFVPYDMLKFQPVTGNFASIPNAYFMGRWFNKTINSEPYVDSVFMGSEVYFKVDGATTVTALMKNMSSAGYTGYISVSIDGGAYTRHQIGDSVVIASSLTPTEHVIRIVTSSIFNNDLRWNNGEGFAFKGFTLDAGTMKAVKPHNRYAVFFGDSITEGIRVTGADSTPESNCSEKTYSYLTCANLDVACIRAAVGGTGITQGGNGAFPKAIDYVDFAMKDIKEAADSPDFVVVNHGTNDSSANSATFQTGYTAYLQKLQRKFPGVPIFAVRPFNGAHANDIQVVIANFKNVFYINTTGWGITYSDGLHPDVAGHLTAATKMTEEIKKILPYTYFMK